jgi:hypothetical protein
LVIYDDIYHWKGPGCECSGCSVYGSESSPSLITCHLRIVDLALKTPSVMHMKRHVVVAEDISEGPRRRICAESLGRQIFRDFNLELKRTLWIECDPFLKETFHVAQFTPAYHDGLEMIYTIDWRPLLSSEKILLQDHLLTFTVQTEK